MFETFADTFSLDKKFDAATIERIRSIASSTTAHKGDYLLRPGQTARTLFFIVEGILSIVLDKGGDEDITGSFLREKQFCTILHSFTDQVPASEGIRAACDVRLLMFAYQDLQDLYRLAPDLKVLIDEVTRHTLLEKIRIHNRYLGLDARARYKAFLEYQPDIALRVSMSEIASYLGVTPQSLSRIRRQRK
jgi:CRP/FNR family transcriptional regulator, anaerobic regulatory protein